MTTNGKAQQTVSPGPGAMVRQEADGSITTEILAETAAVAVAAAQEALVKARVALAMKNPRNIEAVRVRILKDCERPLFADAAIFSKPVGKGFIEGPSVRLAEAFLRQMGNMFVDAMVVADDAEKRIIKVLAMDLETNATDSQDVTIRKQVERRDANGRQVISERLNSYGQRTFLVVATEDELLNLVNATVAKMRRNKIIELTPADIVEEAMRACQATCAKTDAKDPDAAKRKLIDAFAEKGVSPDDLVAWMGHPLDKVVPAELAQLRKIYASLSDGETTWAAVMQAKGAEPAGKVTAPTAPAAAAPAQQAPPPQEAKPSGPDLSNVVCGWCGEKGHIAGTCPVRAADEAAKGVGAARPPAGTPAAAPPSPPPAEAPTTKPPEVVQFQPGPAEVEFLAALARATTKREVLGLLKSTEKLPVSRQAFAREKLGARLKEMA